MVLVACTCTFSLVLGISPAVTFRRWAVEGRHTVNPFQNSLLHPCIFWFWWRITFIPSLLKYFLGHLEMEKFLLRSIMLALNIWAVLCQGCSSRALCCLEGTRAFGNRHWILSPSLVESLGYCENCFPFERGEVKGARRSGTIYWGKLGGLQAPLLMTSQLAGCPCLRYTIGLCFSHEFTECSFALSLGCFSSPYLSSCIINTEVKILQLYILLGLNFL